MARRNPESELRETVSELNLITEGAQESLRLLRDGKISKAIARLSEVLPEKKTDDGEE